MADEELIILPELVFEEGAQEGEMEAASGAAMEGFSDEVSFAQEMEACWALGPLRVCASVVGPGAVRVTASLFGQTILSTTLNAAKTKVCASANIGLAKVQICVILDIARRMVRLEGRLCVRKLPWSWRCTNFNVRLISW